jgi:hypothetical protein
MGMEIVFKEHFDEAVKKIVDTSKDRVHEAVNEVRNTTLETLTGERTGRMYTIPGTNKEYQASAPGEPPAIQLGDLFKSVKGGVDKENDKVIGYVGTDLDHGRVLEFGRRDGHMAPRPWLRISFEKAEAKVKEIFLRTWF